MVSNEKGESLTRGAYDGCGMEALKYLEIIRFLDAMRRR